MDVQIQQNARGSVHTAMYNWTMPASELSANDGEQTMSTRLSKFESPGDTSVEQCLKHVWKHHPKPKIIPKSEL